MRAVQCIVTLVDTRVWAHELSCLGVLVLWRAHVGDFGHGISNR